MFGTEVHEPPYAHLCLRASKAICILQAISIAQCHNLSSKCCFMSNLAHKLPKKNESLLHEENEEKIETDDERSDLRFVGQRGMTTEICGRKSRKPKKKELMG